MSKHDPWAVYRPTTKKYDPDDPHFNPMHPPEGYPIELLEAEWGEDSGDETEEEPSTCA